MREHHFWVQNVSSSISVLYYYNEAIHHDHKALFCRIIYGHDLLLFNVNEEEQADADVAFDVLFM